MVKKINNPENNMVLQILEEVILDILHLYPTST